MNLDEYTTYSIALDFPFLSCLVKKLRVNSKKSESYLRMFTQRF